MFFVPFAKGTDEVLRSKAEARGFSMLITNNLLGKLNFSILIYRNRRKMTTILLIIENPLASD
jgi:hypothetical protein